MTRSNVHQGETFDLASAACSHRKLITERCEQCELHVPVDHARDQFVSSDGTMTDAWIRACREEYDV